jgi:hypothetical protein
VFYAEYVEPYIYAIKNAEKLLKLDGDPDDFAIILSRMLFHKDHDDDDVDELPSILCKDVLGPFIKESSKSEYIIKSVIVDDNKNADGTATTAASTTATETLKGVNVGYNLGPVTLNAWYVDGSDVGGTAGNDGKAVMFITTTKF